MNNNIYGHSQTPLVTPTQATPQQASPSPTEVRQQLSQAMHEAQDVLFKAKTVFPFTLFPDVLVIDRSQVTVSHRTFWQIGEVVSIRIEDILNVTAQVGPFFGSIKISTRFFNDQTQPYVVNYLWREDALKAKRLLQGYVIAAQRNVDSSSLSSEQLVTLLDELGRGAPEEYKQ